MCLTGIIPGFASALLTTPNRVANLLAFSIIEAKIVREENCINKNMICMQRCLASGSGHKTKRGYLTLKKMLHGAHTDEPSPC